MRATMLLSDAAQAVQGKLYVIGGGWTMTVPGASSAVAIQMLVPWDQTNTRHRWRLELLDADGGQVVLPSPAGERPVELEGEFEVGRPAGVPRGADIGVAIAVNVGPLPLELGRYEWRLSIDGELDENWRLAFTVVQAVPQER